MSESSALLAAILASPADDAPRLVYADWLDENGDTSRAAFIRVQVALARLPTTDPKHAELVRIERKLWSKHLAEWTAWAPRWIEITGFHRGFLERIRCDAKVYLER